MKSLVGSKKEWICVLVVVVAALLGVGFVQSVLRRLSIDRTKLGVEGITLRDSLPALLQKWGQPTDYQDAFDGHRDLLWDAHRSALVAPTGEIKKLRGRSLEFNGRCLFKTGDSTLWVRYQFGPPESINSTGVFWYYQLTSNQRLSIHITGRIWSIEIGDVRAIKLLEQFYLNEMKKEASLRRRSEALPTPR